jgi:6-phosphogluconolactonase
VSRYPDAESLARDVARRFARICRDDIARRGEFLALLPGGRSPGRFYALLGEDPLRSRIPWEGIHLFLTDERCVPPENFQSNDSLIRGTLLNAVAGRGLSFHAPPGSGGDASDRAALWEGELREFFLARPRAGGMPRFDLAMVGIGADGHTAGLFPGDPASLEERGWTAAVTVPRGDPRVPRITMTMPALTSARRVWVYAPGREKRELAERIFAGDPRTVSLPAARLAVGRRVRWFVTET